VSEQYHPPGSAAQPGVEPTEASVGSLVTEVTRDLTTLFRQELELAKAEIKEEVGKAGKGAGLLGGAGFAGYLVLLFLSLALMFGLWAWMPLGWAALIVAVLWGIVAAVLYARGRRSLREVSPKPERTIETMKEDVEWAKTRTR
jgi:Flp pilus assembly protein TadB